MEDNRILKIVMACVVIALILTATYLLMYMKQIHYSRFITGGMIISGIILGILIIRKLGNKELQK